MVSKEENPLIPFQSDRLSDGEKEAIWENIVRMAQNDEPGSLRKKNKHRKGIIAAGMFAVLGSVALAGYTHPQILSIGKTFNLLENKMFSPPEVSQAVSLGYGEKVNQSKTSQGITLTIGNVYADPTKLVFDMVESFPSKKSGEPIIRDQDITLDINGTRKLYNFSGGDFQAVSGDKYAGIVYFPVSNDQPYMPLPSNFTLNVHVHKIGNVMGDWAFSIPVSQQKLQKSTKRFHPNASISKPGYNLKITDVTVNPVQTIIQGTITIPVQANVPNRMYVEDNRGQVIGGEVESQKVVKKTGNKEVVQIVVTGSALSAGTTQLTIIPMSHSSTEPVDLSGGNYPVEMTLLPGLQASITGVDYHFNSTVVHLSVDQAKYNKLTTYEGRSIAGQFGLEENDSKGFDFIGSRSIKFSSSSSNDAQIIFPRVARNKKWGLEHNYTLIHSGLALVVPLR